MCNVQGSMFKTKLSRLLFADCCFMQKNLLSAVAISLLLCSSTSAQDKPCPDIPGQTSETHRFHHEGETIEIALRIDSPDCEPVALQLHWTNGRNNGSNFNITFLDSNNRPIYAKQISAFMTGVLELPLSSIEAQPVYGSSVKLVSVPMTIRIQTVSPFAGSALLSYSLARVARVTKKEKGAEGFRTSDGTETNEANEIVGIHDAVRLIGATRLSLVQIELKTTRPFPVKDVPLRLRIGKRIFVDELTGDHTGRNLTLTLTPQMFAELNDDDEVVAFFGEALPSSVAASESAERDVWRFGKLRKNMRKA